MSLLVCKYWPHFSTNPNFHDATYQFFCGWHIILKCLSHVRVYLCFFACSRSVVESSSFFILSDRWAPPRNISEYAQCKCDLAIQITDAMTITFVAVGLKMERSSEIQSPIAHGPSFSGLTRHVAQRRRLHGGGLGSNICQTPRDQFAIKSRDRWVHAWTGLRLHCVCLSLCLHDYVSVLPLFSPFVSSSIHSSVRHAHPSFIRFPFSEFYATIHLFRITDWIILRIWLLNVNYAYLTQSHFDIWVSVVEQKETATFHLHDPSFYINLQVVKHFYL